MDSDRGKIRNRAYANQVRDFSGMRDGNITMTDVDGMEDYQNTCWVFVETKYENAELPFGQRLAFERLCDDLQHVKPTIFIVASHNCTGDIDVANTTVTEYRFRGRWHKTSATTTTKELKDRFITWAKHDVELGKG